MSEQEKTEELLKQLDSQISGLSSEQAASRKKFTQEKAPRFKTEAILLLNNFNSPLVLLLLATAVISIYFKDTLNASIVLFIVIVSGLLSFFQERKAFLSTQKLIEALHLKINVLRDGVNCLLKSEDLVVGDILILDAGDLVPLDAVLIESKDLFIDESSLTGESIPKEKQVGIDPILKMGSSVLSGMGKAVIGKQNTEENFSKLLNYISRANRQSHFSHGLLNFSKFLMRATLIFVTGVFIVVSFKGPILQAFLFSLAIAVGLSPQLLPAILTTNLAIGARKMAKAGAITKKLESIETFGNMDLLCCDKTGTLTKGKVEMYEALDLDGIKSSSVRRLGYINASLQTGFQNSLDQAILEANHDTPTNFKKLDEIPYDFNRKILSIAALVEDKKLLISKGALENVLSLCAGTSIEKQKILARAETFYAEGFRVLGIASKPLDKSIVQKSDEVDLHFDGFLLFYDPIKEDGPQTLQHLKDLGIRLVMITGDHPVIASYVGKKSGFSRTECLVQNDIKDLSEDKLFKALESHDIFARIEPLEKARLIETFKKMGYTTGFLGDGINDSAALHAADVGISVETGSDLTRATADFILVKKHLSILIHAVKEGRKTFSNTLKYILMAVSANFGNMFSMAGISLFLPFLPLLPTQVLLVNLFQDIPEMGIATDNVHPEVIRKPQKWDLKFIRSFMIVFGLLSSIFDYATFFTLIGLHASQEEFRSAWFTESVISATFIIFFVRTRFPFYKSKPSLLLSCLILSIIVLTLALPYTPLGPLFGIIALPAYLYGAIFMIVLCYVGLVEWTKRGFYKWIRRKNGIGS